MDMKTPWIWKNGKLIKRDDAKEHNLSHTLHYGSGVFEGIRFYDTSDGVKIFRLKEHIDRLFYSAGVLGLQIEFSKKYIMEACLEIVKRSKEKSGYIRPIVYYGYGNMGLYPKNLKTEVVISVWKWGKYLNKQTIDVKISKIKKTHPATTDMNAKICGNYANSVLVDLEIKKAGFDEGLLVDIDGYIAEGPGENIFFIKNKKEILTPRVGNILPGITRDSIIKIIKDKFGIIVKETQIPPYRLNEYEESFFVGTAAEVTLINSITDIHGVRNNYDSGIKDSISRKIQTFYMEAVNGRDQKYKKWLY